MNNSIEKLKNHCIFNDGECYVLSILARKKNHENMTDSQQIMRRKIFSNEEEMHDAYDYLKQKALSDPDHLYYMYVSVNSRNVKKALAKYQNLLIQIILNYDFNRVKKLTSKWFSTLEKDECRGSVRNYMIDLDDKSLLNYVKDYLNNNQIEIKSINETMNGYHFIIKPLNVKKFREDFKQINEHEKIVELKKDGLTFIEAINVK